MNRYQANHRHAFPASYEICTMIILLLNSIIDLKLFTFPIAELALSKRHQKSRMAEPEKK